jgi:protein-disulfide isomerase
MRRALEDVVGNYVLRGEAEKRGFTVEQLLAIEVPKRIIPVADAQIRSFYDKTGRGAGTSYEEAAPTIKTMLELQQMRQARMAYVAELRRTTDVLIGLRPPRVSVDVARDDPAKGAGEGKATIDLVEFSDFQCPYCRQIAPILDQIVAKYGDQVRVTWKDFPLPNHPYARRAADAAKCAHEQGKFWEYHDLLFANQQALQVSDLSRYASTLMLDSTAFEKCFKSQDSERLTRVVEQARQIGVGSTPTVFINGRLIAGAAPFEAYESIILDELRSMSAGVPESASRSKAVDTRR